MAVHASQRYNILGSGRQLRRDGGFDISIGTIVPFPTVPLGDYPADPSLDGAVKRIAADPKFAALGIGLIDLTLPLPSAGAPYGGANDQKPMPIGSICKVTAMYAAFQLRYAVAQALVGIDRKPGETGASIIAEAQKQLRTLPGSPYWNRFPQDFPKLDKILSVTPDSNGPGWTVFFTQTGQDFSELHSWDPHLEHLISLAKAQSVGFWQQLEMMIGMSDNCASMACIQAIGFQYIDGLLAAAGLFKDNKGLWLGAPYAKACVGNPLSWQPAPGYSFPGDDGSQVGTAASLAKFLGRLNARELASADDSHAMLNLMNKSAPPGNATLSYFQDGLAASLPPGLQDSSFVVVSKLGIGKFMGDAAIIQHRTETGGLIQYAAVGLGDPLTDNAQSLHALIVELDDLITSRHTSPVPP